MAGDPAAAVTAGEEGCRLLEEQGWESNLSSVAGLLAQAYYALGQFDEAGAIESVMARAKNRRRRLIPRGRLAACAGSF